MNSEIRSNVSEIVLRNPIHIFSFGFGVGFIPIAPGTFGTLLAVPIFLLLASFSPVIYLSFVVIIFVTGCWASKCTAEALGTHDHPGIVIDEIVGYLVTMILVPPIWYWVVLGFLLFRVFDIWKPWPIRLVDKRIKGGLGIMLDDLFAGFFGLLSLHIVVWSAQFL